MLVTNLSKIKRDRMLEFLETLKQQHTDDESIRAFSELNNHLLEKKYGLVWEEHTELVDKMLEEKIPVFCEDKERKIVSDSEAMYNFIIEGDNLQSLYLLEKTHKEKIDVIYIDPPYNTGKKDFIFNDRIVGVDDAYKHSKWLSFMSKRLRIARNLLSKEGVIFISIDDNEQANLKLLCDEIFDESNFIALLAVENNPKGRKNSNFVSVSNDYLLIYAKDANKSSFIENIPKDTKDLAQDEDGNFVHNSGKRVLVGENNFNQAVTDFSSNKHYTVYFNRDSSDIIIVKEKDIEEIDQSLSVSGYDRYYSYNSGKFVLNTYSADKLMDLFENQALDFKNGKIYEKNFSTSIRIKSIITNRKYKAVINNCEVDYMIDVKTTSAKQELKTIFNSREAPFSNPKNTGLLRLIITLFEKKDIIVLDFFAGSGTTAQAVMELNEIDNGCRRYIICTNNEITEENQIEYFVSKGYIDKRPRKNSNAEIEWLVKWGDFIASSKYFEVINSEEYQGLGICRSVTYPRIRTVITGNRQDETKYSDGLSANLKYFKCEWTNRKPDDYLLSNALCLHIREMIELQNGIEIDNVKNVLILNKDDFKNTLINSDVHMQVENVWINQNMIFNSEELEILNVIGYKYIPKEFFGQELREVAE
jgi:adenine-specific DNA-methyltransferase